MLSVHSAVTFPVSKWLSPDERQGYHVLLFPVISCVIMIWCPVLYYVVVAISGLVLCCCCNFLSCTMLLLQSPVSDELNFFLAFTMFDIRVGLVGIWSLALLSLLLLLPFLLTLKLLLSFLWTHYIIFTTVNRSEELNLKRLNLSIY